MPLKGDRSPGQWPCLPSPLMHCALPPFEPPDGVHQRRLALAVVGGARPRGDRHLSAIARLQGFSSCSPAAFPHQWAVWWGEASRAAASAPPSASRIFVILVEAEGELSRGLPLCRQRPAPSLSDLGRRAFAACGAGSCRASGSPAQAALALLPVSPPPLVLAAPPDVGGSPNTSYAARAAFVF